MEDKNQPIESLSQGTETAGEGSPSAQPAARVGSWIKNTVYGFAGLVILALGITVVSPETAVAVTQYLPKEYQETIFASAAPSGTCSAGMPVGGYAGGSCCPSMATSGSTGTSCCPASAGSEVVDESLAADIPSLSLDTMLAGLSDN